MGSKLLLDTGVLIDIEKGDLGLHAVVEPDDDVALAVITVGELQIGVEKSDEDHRKHRRRFLQRIIERVPIIDYTLPVALAHAKVAAAMAGRGLTRSRPDLMIAATALITGRTLVTTDTGFTEIRGLTLRRPARR